MSREFLKSTTRRLDSFAGDGSTGWNRAWGQEVIYKFLLPKVKPGDRVLDLCSGYGRSSIPLVMEGAKVVLVDQNKEDTNHARELFSEAGLIRRLERVIVADVSTLSPKEVGLFKFIIACNATTHMMKTGAVDFIGRLPLFLKISTSYIYVDVPSRLGKMYDMYRNYDYGNRVEVDTYEELCDCSGIEKMEPIPFFAPGEVEMIFKNQGGLILSNREFEVVDNNFNREIIARFN